VLLVDNVPCLSHGHTAWDVMFLCVCAVVVFFDFVSVFVLKNKMLSVSCT